MYAIATLCVLCGHYFRAGNHRDVDHMQCDRYVHVRISMPPIPNLPAWDAGMYFLGIIKTFLCFRDVLSAHISSKASRKGPIGRDKDTVLKILQSSVEKKHK